MEAKKAKRRWTRQEILAAVADVYRREKAELHRLSQAALAAAQRGEAAVYAIQEEQVERQQIVVTTVTQVVAALGISEEELRQAATDEEEE